MQENNHKYQLPSDLNDLQPKTTILTSTDHKSGPSSVDCKTSDLKGEGSDQRSLGYSEKGKLEREMAESEIESSRKTDERCQSTVPNSSDKIQRDNISQLPSPPDTGDSAAFILSSIRKGLTISGEVSSTHNSLLSPEGTCIPITAHTETMQHSAPVRNRISCILDDIRADTANIQSKVHSSTPVKEASTLIDTFRKRLDQHVSDFAKETELLMQQKQYGIHVQKVEENPDTYTNVKIPKNVYRVLDHKETEVTSTIEEPTWYKSVTNHYLPDGMPTSYSYRPYTFVPSSVPPLYPYIETLPLSSLPRSLTNSEVTLIPLSSIYPQRIHYTAQSQFNYLGISVLGTSGPNIFPAAEPMMEKMSYKVKHTSAVGMENIGSMKTEIRIEQDEYLKRKRRSHYADNSIRCQQCGTSSTPEWRRGPDGLRTLCNACGLFHAKITRKKGEQEAFRLLRMRQPSKHH